MPLEGNRKQEAGDVVASKREQLSLGWTSAHSAVDSMLDALIELQKLHGVPRTPFQASIGVDIDWICLVVSWLHELISQLEGVYNGKTPEHGQPRQSPF